MLRLVSSRQLNSAVARVGVGRLVRSCCAVAG